MEPTILTPQPTPEPAPAISEEALLNSLFGTPAPEPVAEPAPEMITEPPAEAAPAVAAPVGTTPETELEVLPEPQRNINDDRFFGLINEMRRDRETNNQLLKQLITPPDIQDEIPEEERILNERLKQAVDPLKQENDLLKKQVEQLVSLEAQRATDSFVSGMQAKYPDFNAQAIADEMLNIAVDLYNGYTAQGMTHEKAAERAEEAVRMQYDNPKGAERLYFMMRSSAPTPAPQAAPQRTPDQHVSGQSTPTPPKNWKDKMKSGNEAEKDSVFNDLFTGG